MRTDYAAEHKAYIACQFFCKTLLVHQAIEHRQNGAETYPRREIAEYKGLRAYDRRRQLNRRCIGFHPKNSDRNAISVKP
jgi:hypothetical protein